MSNKTRKTRRRNIILGCFIVLGLSFDPAAFDIRLNFGVQSRKCSAAKSITTISHVPAIRVNNNMLVALPACSHNEDNWRKNTNKNKDVQTPSTSRNLFPWFQILLLFIFGKFVSVTISSDHLSSLGVGTAIAGVAPYVATLTKTTRSRLYPASSANYLQQAAFLGASFALFRSLGSCARSISSWYMGLLEWSPLCTKTVTTATIGVLGDTTAQYFETRFQKFSQESEEADVKSDGKSDDMDGSIDNKCISWFKNYDRRRGMSVFGENILVSGPLLHFAYNAMENLLPTSTGGKSAALAALGHALIDNFVLDTIFLAIMFTITGITEGYVREIIPQFQKDFVPTLKMGWMTGLCLLPIQFLLFRFFPLSLRVLGVNIIDIFWEAYISYMVHRRRRKWGTV